MLKHKLLTFALITLLPVSLATAADHLDAPNLAGMGDLDINDLYAFQSPNDTNNTVLIMTVNPASRVLSGSTFNPNASYEIQIDNTGDAVADVTYSATFSPAVSAPGVGTSQAYTIDRTVGATTTPGYAAGVTGQSIGTTTGGQVHAGQFEDPFFFDLNGFNDGLNFTGADFFAGLDVSAIVLEVPSSELNGADTNIAVWARTVVGGDQIDRIGRPAINTVLIPSARKQEFNEGSPDSDFADFGGDVNAAIAGLSDQSNADALTPILLPDVLTFDTSDASGFLNGRGLADDVIDAELTLLTASSTTIGDGVDANDVPFPGVFPYLATANVGVPEPASIALLAFILSGLGLHRRR